MIIAAMYCGLCEKDEMRQMYQLFMSRAIQEHPQLYEWLQNLGTGQHRSFHILCQAQRLLEHNREPDGCWLGHHVQGLEIFLATVFFLEMMLKMYAFGLRGPHAYFRGPQNCFDTVILFLWWEQRDRFHQHSLHCP